MTAQALSGSWRATPAGKTRARGAGVPLVGQPGPWNSITDVAGVEVGYCTLITGHGPLRVGEGPVRTGVTAIFPHGRARANAAAWAGVFCMSGNGEMSGAAFIDERGRFDGPITLTNTHSCGLTRDVTAQWLFGQRREGDKLDQPFWLPVSAETHDGRLNDVNGHHVKAAHVVAAFEDARSGPIEQGSVGGGTGMRCFEFKGGSGTASREVDYAGQTFRVGAFVQSNFGKRHLLRIAGVPVGLEIPTVETQPPEHGSIIVVIATDAPMAPHQLRRVARRGAYGVSACGGIASNESGDFFLAFSTANAAAVETHGGILTVQMLGEEAMSAFYEATIQAVEEAILDSIFANETMTGIDDFTVYGLPLETVRDILRRYNRLEPALWTLLLPRAPAPRKRLTVPEIAVHINIVYIQVVPRRLRGRGPCTRTTSPIRPGSTSVRSRFCRAEIPAIRSTISPIRSMASGVRARGSGTPMGSTAWT